jgi:type IV secretion system protein VirB10
MTAPLVELGAPAAPDIDPHAPKLSPDDPRLRVSRPAARTLRTGPLVALTACLFGAVMLAVAFAFQSPRASSASRPEPSGAPAPPNIPEAIRNASAAPAVPTRPDAGPPRGRMAFSEREIGPEDVNRRLGQEQAFKAQGAPILFETAGGSAQGEREADPTRPSSVAPAEPAATAATPSPFGGDSDQNMQERKNAFLDGQGAKTTDYLARGLQHPRSPYELKAGTIVPAALITGINSDLPGPVIGQVRENVYDTVSGNTLLIPQGSRLLAQYDSMVAWGQERVLVCWNRLVFPNGDSIDLQCMPAADLQGAAGLTDEVNEHWFRLVKGAAVASLLAATTAAVAGNTDGVNPTLTQIAARNAAGQINGVGQQLTARNLRIQPTITVRPGYSVNVILTKDMVLPPYVDASPAPGIRQ